MVASKIWHYPATILNPPPRPGFGDVSAPPSPAVNHFFKRFHTLAQAFWPIWANHPGTGTPHKAPCPAATRRPAPARQRFSPRPAIFLLQPPGRVYKSPSPKGCGRSSGVEHNLAKVRVVSSNLIARSNLPGQGTLKRPPQGGLLRCISRHSRKEHLAGRLPGWRDPGPGAKRKSPSRIRHPAPLGTRSRRTRTWPA